MTRHVLGLFTNEGVALIGVSWRKRGRGLPMMEVLTLPIAENLDVLDVTFARPDLTTFARLDELGLKVVGQRPEPDRAVLACRVVEPDQWCRRCGCQGAARDTVIRRLAHEPLGWRPSMLEVTVRRYRCTGCGHVWRHDTTLAPQPRAKVSRRGLGWALEGIVCQHLSMARVAQGLGAAWNTANDAVLAEGKRALIDDPGRFDGVRAIGVDEHVWRRSRRAEKYARGDHRPHSDQRGNRPFTTVRHGPGSVQAGIQTVARPASKVLTGRR